MCADGYSSVPHLPHKVILVSPIKWMCSHGIMSGKKAKNKPWLCPVKGQKSGLCSWTGVRNQFSNLSLSTTRTTSHYQMLVIHTALYLTFMFCLETPKDSSGPTDFSFTRNPACPGTQYTPTMFQVEISFNAFQQCRRYLDVVLTVWRAFRVTWLSEKILMYFSGLAFVWIS
jgi:hypothetical protein